MVKSHAKNVEISTAIELILGGAWPLQAPSTESRQHTPVGLRHTGGCCLVASKEIDLGE